MKLVTKTLLVMAIAAAFSASALACDGPKITGGENIVNDKPALPTAPQDAVPVKNTGHGSSSAQSGSTVAPVAKPAEVPASGSGQGF